MKRIHADENIATTDNEVLGLIPAAGAEIFAILTRPTVDANGWGVVILNGGANNPSMGRNRMSVDIARNMAAQGFHVVRFDYHGVGESTGQVAQMRLDMPFVDDLVAVASWARANGVEKLVLTGCCFGSRTSLASAPHIPGLAGMVIFGTPIRDFGKGARNKRMTRTAIDWSVWEFIRRGLRVRTLSGLFDARRRGRYRRLVGAKIGFVGRKARKRLSAEADPDLYWVSEGLLSQIQYLVENSIPCVFVYDDKDQYYKEITEAMKGRLGHLIEDPRSRVEIRLVDGRQVGRGRLIAESTLLEVVVGFAGQWRTDSGTR